MTGRKRDPLPGHRRRGKRFSPPLTQVGGLSEVRWIDDLLPEFLWIDMLITAHGLKGTFRIIEAIVESKPQIESSEQSWLSRMSTYATLESDAAIALTRHLDESGHLSELQSAVEPLVVHYPAFPMRWLFQERDAAGELGLVRQSVSRMLDRWSEDATWVQIAVVYALMGERRLHFPSDSVLAEFPEVEQYPTTQVSRMIASACRALINSFPVSEAAVESHEWTRYFWSRGMELEPCVPIGPRSDE